MFRNRKSDRRRPRPVRRRAPLGLETLEDRTAPSAGPRLVSQNPIDPSKSAAPLSSVRVQFDSTIDPSTFTPADVVSFTGPGGPVTVNSVTPTPGGSNAFFDINFATQTQAGAYSFTLGPDIRDMTGRQMDQNNNNVAGETPGDQYTGAFHLYGPRVSFHTQSPSSAAPVGTQDRLRVVFTAAMDGSTFTPADVSIAGPGGPVAVTSVAADPAQPTTAFFVSFAPQGVAGNYNFSIGPNINDASGNPLDQNQNQVTGEVPGDQYISTFSVAQFLVSTAQAAGIPVGPVSSDRLTFSRQVDLSTFDTSDLTLTGPGGAVAVSSITPVGSTGTQFDVNFAPQTSLGNYTLVVGPAISDVYGNGMDQNRNGIPGEVPGDRFTSSFALAGPRVSLVTPNTTSNLPGVSTGTVFFTQAMDPSTFTPSDIVLTGPNGVVPITSVTPVSGNTQFTVTFPAQGTAGTYTWRVGPDIRNTAGNQLDQNGNNIPGETPGDQFTSSFIITAPRVTLVNPGGGSTALGPISKISLTFSQDMDGSTFTPSDVVSFTGPNGAIAITGVTQTGARTFDVTFDPQNADGTYTFVAGPDIRDTFGNPMNQNNNAIAGEDPGDRVTTSFNLNQFGPDAFGYVARPTAWQNIDLEPGQPGVFTILDNVDDAAAAVNLGANTFNFYGLVYTGNNQLYVNTNGMITFGSASNQANSTSSKSASQQLVAQPYIAAFYRDWTTSDSVFPDGVPAGAVLGKFEDTNADGTPDRLIIEWSDVRNFISLAQNKSVTFQAILDLNTGANASGVTLNYLQTQTLDPQVDNGNIVGIRQGGNFPSPSILITPTNQFGPFGFPPSPWVGPGKAMRFTAPPIGGTVSGVKFNDLNRNGVRDAGEPGLAGWQVYLDENNNGSLDAGEPTTLTDGSGNYTFSGVVPGTHTVREVGQAGWLPSRPGAGGTVANGGFETGDLTGWSRIGTALVEPTFGNLAPTEGSKQVFLYSGSAFGFTTAPVASLESFLGVASGTLSSLAGVNVVQGGAVKQTIFATAGSSLTFDYDLLTGEAPTQLRDLIFVTVAGNSGAVVINNTRQLTGSDPSTFFFEQSGYLTFAYTFPTTGVYTIGIGVADGVNSANSSGMLLDNVRLLGGAYPVGVPARQAVAGKDFGNFQLPVAADDSFSTDEDTPLNVAAPGVLANDTTYLPGGTLSAALVSGPAHGSLTFNADGSFQYTPALNFSGSDSFTYKANDGFDTNVATVSLTVNPVADAPTLSVADASGTENSAIGLSIAAALTDTDGSETLAVRIDGVPADATLSAGANLGGGSWLLTPAQLSGLTLTKLDNGTFTLTVTATSTETANGSTASTSAGLNVTVTNVAPTAAINGAPASSLEGTEIDLTSTVTDPSPTDTAAGFTYAWSVTKDGNAFASGSSAGFSFTPDDNGTYVVTLTATDKDGGVGTASATITVTNVAPTASLSGPTGGVRGQWLTYTLGASDPSSVDQAAGFTYSIDWDGDGTVDQIVSGPSGTQVTHVYPVEGGYTVRVTAADKDGGTSAAVSRGVAVAIIQLEPDPADPSKTALAIGGTLAGDDIHVMKDNPTGVRVHLNGTWYGPFTPTGHVLVYAQAGGDVVIVNPNVTLPTMLFGGDGNDLLMGGGGNNVLVGGTGIDVLTGSGARDLLIGGAGSDVLDGAGGDDLLIAGPTAYDCNEAALAGVMAEWVRVDQTYEQRVDHLRNGTGLTGGSRLDASTVFDDGALDVLMGGSGRDWYFASLTGDLIVDRAANEFVN